MKYFEYHFSFAGRYVIAEEAGGICMVFPAGGKEVSGWTKEETPLLCEAAHQLEEYFSGKRQRFDLPLAPRGTAFQKRVWDVLTMIPYGETVTYGWVAAAAGSPKGAQAAGQAVGANPIPFLIPCHRVVGKNGALTGFALGLAQKETLLRLEQR